MKNYLCIIVLYLSTCFSGSCQKLSGQWSGQLTQTAGKFGLITIQVKILQNGNTITGEIKTIVKSAFIVQQFTGSISKDEVTMTETKVLKEVGNLDWYIKKMRGRLVNEGGAMTIEGTWTSQQGYQFGAYVPARFSGGTFTVSKPGPVSPEKETPNVNITLRVLDKRTLKPVNTKLTITVLSGRKAIPLKYGDGFYTFKAEKGKGIEISASAPGYEPFTETIQIGKDDLTRRVLMTPGPPKTEESTLTRTNKSEQPKLGDTLQLSLHFEQSKAALLPESKPELEKILVFLRGYPTAKIELIGHTDNVGNPVRNIRLSSDRVNAIKRYLVSNMISPERISCRALGGQMPIAENNSEENRKKNRRVEMRVVKL